MGIVTPSFNAPHHHTHTDFTHPTTTPPSLPRRRPPPQPYPQPSDSIDSILTTGLPSAAAPPATAISTPPPSRPRFPPSPPSSTTSSGVRPRPDRYRVRFRRRITGMGCDARRERVYRMKNNDMSHLVQSRRSLSATTGASHFGIVMVMPRNNEKQLK